MNEKFSKLLKSFLELRTDLDRKITSSKKLFHETIF